ncbi:MULTISPECIES: DNA gyrase inhibitor YacG [unclassified Acinetobacter]|uniref:DNA gyrase inhibitor YacG n=1 Tax=unclassified Acinetobacter TaxID=196816 RepID=UPI0035B74720
MVTELNCPRCQKLTTWQDNPYRPFCSERCRLIDLGAWANEDYKIASQDSASNNTPEHDQD